MGVVFACIAPHGDEIIPELAGEKLEAFTKTRRGMEELARLMKKQKPETIVLATPHNLRLESTIGVITSEYTAGTLEANKNQVKLRCRCDREFAREVIENAKKADLPVVGANYGTSEGEGSCMPMDWGSLIPLWFLTRRGKNRIRTLIVTPSREIPLRSLVRLGRVIARTAEAAEKRVAFVASADQAHTYKADGPYGFHSSSGRFDEMVKRAVLKNDLKPLFRLPPNLVEEAKPDSLWQMAILQGILETVTMEGRLLSFEAPTYFGMLCAAYVRLKNEAD